MGTKSGRYLSSDLDALFDKARATRPDTLSLELGFEARLMANLLPRKREVGLRWDDASWRCIPFFAGIVVVLLFWNATTVSDLNDVEQSFQFENQDSLDLLIDLDK